MIGRALLAVAICAAGACAPSPELRPKSGISPTVCRECFWKYQPEGLQRELIAYYSAHRYSDPLVDAQRILLVATIEGDRDGLCRERAHFRSFAEAETSPARALYAAEVLAFTARDCGKSPARAYRDAADKARAAGEAFKADVYDRVARDAFVPAIGDASLEADLHASAGARSIVIGASRIVVSPASRVGVQVERTVRDWLSLQLGWNGEGAPVDRSALLDWHEGACLRRLLEATGAEIVPLSGVLAVHDHGRWLAPDERGIFRFEVLDDKIQYPTTLVDGSLALIVDTHGISALVAPAVERDASLVVGCGDTQDKMKAALTLARRGIDVWFPCDRFVGDIVGYDAPGVLIGSAPVRKEGGHAVVGDRPIRFDLKETFVAEDYRGIGPLRYYDAPARYFRALSKSVPLQVDYVAVDGAGESSTIILRANELSSSAIAVRVQTPEDAAPVRAWLAASSKHRAILFHTAPYAPGYALFDEFPAQTTFGDPHPRFE